jgi:putative PIN family toxin of toxin-antitoxin system
MLRVVLDTNVLVAGLRSRTGASFLLLSLVERGRLRLCASAPLLDEYEEVLRRAEHRKVHGLDDVAIRLLIAGLVQVAELAETRVHLRLVMKHDPDDAMVAEAAIDAGADHLVTHNMRHFDEVRRFVSVVTPGQLLRIMAQ